MKSEEFQFGYYDRINQIQARRNDEEYMRGWMSQDVILPAIVTDVVTPVKKESFFKRLFAKKEESKFTGSFGGGYTDTTSDSMLMINDSFTAFAEEITV